MRRTMIALILCAIALPAAAQKNAEFTVGEVKIELPLPDGYCIPAGPGVAVAQVVAAADTGNVTDLTLFPCNDQSGTAPDYYLVKTPASVFSTPAPRAQLLASLKAEFDKPGFAEAMASTANNSASEAYSRLLKQKAEVAGKVEPMGLDQTCAYLGGVLQFDSPAVSYKRAVSGCITSVGDRVVMIYRYSQGEPANVLAKMPSAKALAQAMRVKK